MTDNVTRLNDRATTHAQVDEDVVRTLEFYLECAKRGEVIGVGLILIQPGSSVITMAKGAGASHYNIIAGSEILKAMAVAAQLSIVEEVPDR